MEFRILGGLEALAGGERLPLGGAREQKTLAVLLLEAGQVVPVPTLVDAVWDGGAPATAAKQVRNAVSRLRSVFTAAGAGTAITADGTGYRIAVLDEQLDARRFTAQVDSANRDATAGELARAVETLRSALDLWRGPALADLGGRVIEAAAAAWNERRLAVCETYVDHELALGHHHEVVDGLWAMVAESPLREKPLAQLMLALYRCGRRAEALDVYRDARTRFAVDLGVEPGPELRRLQQRMLDDDPVIAAPGPVSVIRMTGERAPHVPRRLPAGPRHFVGRAAYLDTLDRLIETGTGGTVVISAVDGTAGIGKTALAVHWAHQAAHRFPDGQLYVNLRGFDPAGEPVTPARALRDFLDALGVPPGRVPPDAGAQAELYRDLLADRRVLVLLDNARDAEQVRPLLPASPSCLTIVTSRSRLTELVDAGDASPVTLDLFTTGEAYELLAEKLGPERTASAPQSAEVLIGLCARLPLALGVVAAHAAVQPGVPLAAVAAQLVDARSRLGLFASGDLTDPRAVFSWSYRALGERAARMFRLLSLHPGPDIEARAAARLADLPSGATRRALGELVGAHLMTQQADGRYAFHDLLRAYAAGQAHAVDDPAELRAAMARLLDYYLETAQAAVRLLDPVPHEPAGVPRQRGADCAELTDQADALAWFEAERHALPAVIARAGELGLHPHAWRIPWAVAALLDRRGDRHEPAGMLRIALAAARRAGDHQAEAAVQRRLADIAARPAGAAAADRHRAAPDRVRDPVPDGTVPDVV